MSDDPRFRLSAKQAESLANRFSTPLFVMDEATIRNRVLRFRMAFPEGRISFAAKANSAVGLLRLMHKLGCHIDTASLGELAAARRAGVPPGSCTLHGSAKTTDELREAIEQGIGEIVVDSFDELDRLSELQRPKSALLRVNPGVAPETNSKIATSTPESKFGFPTDQVLDAVSRALELRIPLRGFHVHVGSQLVQCEASEEAARCLGRVARMAQEKLGFKAELLNLGGGMAVRYTDEAPLDPEDFLLRIMAAAKAELSSELSPQFAVEPGRALVAEAGVTLYRAVVVKRTSAGTYVSVDGGLADNPRPAMYDAQYQAELTDPSGDPETVKLVGHHCENDVLIPSLPLAGTPKVGDLIQVLTTGAYCQSMASNYNRYPRPPMVVLTPAGEAVQWQRRESLDDILRQDLL